MRIGMQVTGHKKLAADLLAVGADAHDKALKSAVRSAARAIANRAKGHLTHGRGVRTGALRDSITIKLLRPTDTATTALIGPEDAPRIDAEGNRINPGKYGHLVEFGHGGPAPAKPIPFLSRATDESGAEVERIIADAMQRHLRKYG